MRKIDPVKHENKKREILDAAMRCFYRKGLRTASTADICEEAKISAGHLYHYFESRDAIIAAIIELRMSQAAVYDNPSKLAAEFVPETLSELRRELNDDLSHVLLTLDLFVEAARNPVVGKVYQELNEKVREKAVGIIRDAQALGQIDPALDPEATIILLFCLFSGSKITRISNSNWDTNKIMSSLKLFISHYLKPPGKPKPSRKTKSRGASVTKSLGGNKF